jgi:hypothetical protein
MGASRPLYRVVLRDPTDDATHDRTPVRRRTLVRAFVVVAAIAQLAVAIVLAVNQGTTPAQEREVATAMPAGAVGAAAPTSTTLPPVVVEVPPATTPARPTTTVVPTGAVYGVIGAGAGGRARADLRDEAGNTWHSEASSSGEYRFDGLTPGSYQLVLSAESSAPACGSDGTCIGSAMAISKRVVEIRPGQEVREDYPVYGPTGPAPPATTTTTGFTDPTTSTTAA